MKQAIVKLCMGPGGAKQPRRSPILGGKVIADYVDATDNQRYVVVERTASKAAAPKPKKQAKPEPDAAVSHA